MWQRGFFVIALGFVAALFPGTVAAAQGLRDRLKDGQPCSFCPELMMLPAGQFLMGSPASEPERLGGETPVRVVIAESFSIGKFAVTFEEWDACLADGGCNGYRPNDFGWGRGARPVIGINFEDAKAYIAWLSAKTGKTYRLPSEAEREYAARAGTTTAFWWGSGILTNQANYNGNSFYLGGGEKGGYRARTVPVIEFEANPWGLFQVHGNVWEWTEDCWNDSNDGNPGNGRARDTGDCTRRVVRGGSWYNIPSFLRSARRHWYSVVIRLPVVGFRLVRDP